MGVVNVTPDSFSTAAQFDDPDAAIAHGRRLMLAEGAAILDVGGESTRPGAEAGGRDEELRRVVPVIEALAAGAAQVSIDTTKREVARAALDAGATTSTTSPPSAPTPSWPASSPSAASTAA
jgi:dihydropteroate synthase